MPARFALPSRTIRRVPVRYQLNKRATAVVASGHPWIFRDQLSSAAGVFVGGQMLRLVDGKNQVVGYGVYEAEGAIAIRIMARGEAPPSSTMYQQRVEAALERRKGVRALTNTWRAIHGESDGLPGVVVDVWDTVVVAQSYSAGVDALTRWAGRAVADRIGVANILWRPARRRVGERGAAAARVLRGEAAGTIEAAEGKLRLLVNVLGGQKSGGYLDLRGLRQHLAQLPLDGARVLNLFAFTGGFAVAAAAAGAGEILNVDASADALSVAERQLMPLGVQLRQEKADVFFWIEELVDAEAYDLVIVDPPSMTSQMSQVPSALAAYRRLYRAVGRHIRPGGLVVAVCCTSRITREQFDRAVSMGLGGDFDHELDVVPEPDHPATFSEARYLKMAQYRRKPL